VLLLRKCQVNMRAREFIQEERTDEVLPIIAGALARGAGSMLAKGAQAVGGAVAKGVGNLASKGAQAVGQAAGNVVKNVAGAVQGQANSSGQAVGSSAAPAGPTTGGKLTAPPGGGQASPQQQQLQQQQTQATSDNLDKIAAQIVALKQDLLKQQQV
jgi:hypothetical protein